MTCPYARALPMAMDLAAERPRRSDVVFDAAAVSVNTIHYLPPTEAESVLRQGLVLVESLMNDCPERAEYVKSAIALLSNLGLTLAMQGRWSGPVRGSNARPPRRSPGSAERFEALLRRAAE